MKTILSFLFLLSVVCRHADAQLMPLVYDRTYGDHLQLQAATADFPNGDVVIAAENAGVVQLSWLNRVGDSRFVKRFTSAEFNKITKLVALADGRVLAVGSRAVPEKESRPAGGRVMVVSAEGLVERSAAVGAKGAVVTAGELLPDGSIILSGSATHTSGDRNGFVCKVNAANRIVYTYVTAVGETCDFFSVQGSKGEYLSAAFSSVSKDGSSVVRLDANGKPDFITVLPDPSFKIEKMAAGSEQELYLIGEGRQVGGAVVKLRREGDVVFQKQIIPASAKARLNHLLLFPTGEILVGGSDSASCVFAMLRNDGTELSVNVDHGTVSAFAMNPSDCVVSLYNPAADRGKIVKLSRQGRNLYTRTTAANYTSLRINSNGDLLMASPQTGRLTMLSSFGEPLFDRFVEEHTPARFGDALLPTSGEAIFMNAEGRVAKLAHGVQVGDMTVNKPMSGRTSATFTVTLSGYSFSAEGAPLPVTVKYRTKALSAAEGVNFDAVAGVISFVPSTDGSDRYLNKFAVEVPVNANDFLEGARSFSLELFDIQQSYLIRASGTAVIEDQPAIAKMITTVPGVEGGKDLTFELGIFKRDGKPLINKTSADIIIDGAYGNGTADALDFDMGRQPRVVIPIGAHSGQFGAATLEDTRYEAAKNVVVDFHKIHAMSDTDVSFGANMLRCTGMIFDQPAVVVIESLGDHTSRTNDVLGGLFKISLARARDGALLTNSSGSDVAVTVAVSDSSTAKRGDDFVITNAHNLHIKGDGRSSAVNLNGLVLHTLEKGTKTVVVTLQDVKAGADAGPVLISPARHTAMFRILNE